MFYFKKQKKSFLKVYNNFGYCFLRIILKNKIK